MPVNNDEDKINDEINMVEDVDDLDAYITERDKREPGFADLVEAALQRRREARARGEDPNDVLQAEDEAPEQPVAPHTSIPR